MAPELHPDGTRTPPELQNSYPSRDALWKAHELLREIATTDDHPRRFEASLILVQTAPCGDTFCASPPLALMQALVDRAPENQWLEAAGAFSALQGLKYSDETALRLVELIAADTQSGDIRPLRIRIPQPLTTNHHPLLPADYAAESFSDVVISHRIILASIAANAPQLQKTRDRVALALAAALPPEVLNQSKPFRQSDVPEELLFRLGHRDHRIASSTASPGDSEIEKDNADQTFEFAMNRLLQAPDWRARLKQLQSEQPPASTGDDGRSELMDSTMMRDDARCASCIRKRLTS